MSSQETVRIVLDATLSEMKPDSALFSMPRYQRRRACLNKRLPHFSIIERFEHIL